MEETTNQEPKTYTEEEYNSLEDTYKRSVADYRNYKRRMETDLTKQISTAKENLLHEFLHLKDDFERGLTSVPNSVIEEAWFVGFALVLKRFSDTLAKYHVTEIPHHKDFDPNLHDPIISETIPHTENSVEVVEHFTKGYKIQDRVLRPAKVKVLRKEAAEEI